MTVAMPRNRPIPSNLMVALNPRFIIMVYGLVLVIMNLRIPRTWSADSMKLELDEQEIRRVLLHLGYWADGYDDRLADKIANQARKAGLDVVR
jgi:hypothetical protein